MLISQLHAKAEASPLPRVECLVLYQVLLERESQSVSHPFHGSRVGITIDWSDLCMYMFRVSNQTFLRLLKQSRKWSELLVQVAAGVTLVAFYLLFLGFIGAITFMRLRRMLIVLWRICD